MAWLSEIERQEQKSIRSTTYRLVGRLFAVYLLLSATQIAGIFYAAYFLWVDGLFYTALLLALPLIAYDIRTGGLPIEYERGIQALFLGSLLALAVSYSASSVFPNVGSFFEGITNLIESNRSALQISAVSTGILTLISVQSNEVQVTAVPELHRRVLGRTVSLRTIVVSLCLLGILGLYVYIRLPFLAKPFGGVIHGDKYATHVPILQGMYRTGDPFHFVNPAYTSMFDPVPSITRYGRVPIFSWGTLPVLVLTPQLGIEFAVRGFTTLLGVLFLLLIFAFIQELFDSTIALVGTLLIATNPLFNIVSYLTVMDLPALVLGFASIVLYLRGAKSYAYLLCGLAALAKYSFLLITVPALAVLILADETEKFYHAVTLGYFTVIPILAFRTLVAPIPGDSLLVGSVRLVGFVVLLGGSVALVERYETQFADFVSRIDQRVRYTLMVGVPILVVVFLWDLIVAFAPSFLTDRYLLFNANMYAVLLERVRTHLSDVVFYLFPIGLLWFFIAGDRDQRTIFVAVLFGTVLYAVVAAKSVFIHVYYKHILMIVGIIGFLGVFDAIRRVTLSSRVVVPAVVALTVLLVLSSQTASVALLNDELRGSEQMGEYIDRNIDDSELVLYTSPYGRLMSIYSEASFTSPLLGNRAALESEIQKKGIGVTLRNKNVVYYLSPGPSEFDEFEHLYKSGDETNERREYILNEVNPESSSDEDTVTFTPPKGAFELEASFGDWFLYRITSEGD